jgi:hypothetical protein
MSVLGKAIDAVLGPPGDDEAIEARISRIEAAAAGGTTTTELLAGGDDDVIRAVGMWAWRRVLLRKSIWVNADVAHAVGRRKLRWTVAEAAWMLRLAATSEIWIGERYGLPVSALGRLTDADRDGLRPLIADALARVERDTAGAVPDRRRLSGALRGFLGGDGFPPWLLHDGDAFGPEARARLADELRDPTVVEFLSHCSRQDKVTPTKKWLAQAKALVAGSPACEGVARELLTLLRTASQDALARGCPDGRRLFRARRHGDAAAGSRLGGRRA